MLLLDRPDQLNALSVELVDATAGLLRDLDADRRTGAVVLAGRGRAFSAGGDLADIAARAGRDEWGRLELLRRLQQLVVGIRSSRLPVIAAVHGPVFGAAWSVVLACDLVVATIDARFSQVFVKRDLVPDLGSAWLLPRAVGMPRAKELMLTGDEVSAEEAHALGLVNVVAPERESALETAIELALRVSEASSETVAMTKALINGAQSSGLDEALRMEEHAQALALGRASTQAALAAFMERRPHEGVKR